MEYSDLLRLYSISFRRVRNISVQYFRHLMNRIDWENRLIQLMGARGTGKTTMMLQRIRTAFPDSQEALYLSLDHLWFKTHSVYDAVEAHVQNGGTHVFLDEVHYDDNWELLIKNLYDDFPSLYIVYKGSSILKLRKAQADLSRRQSEYVLPGLSFIEYLELEGHRGIQSVSLEEISV